MSEAIVFELLKKLADQQVSLATHLETASKRSVEQAELMLKLIERIEALEAANATR